MLSDVISGRPNGRAEWIERCGTWQEPPSATEREKIDIAQRKVARILAKCEFLQHKDWKLIPQGSYRNKTNVRLESDVDICLCLTNAFYFDAPNYDITLEDVGLHPLAFTYEQFKQAVGNSFVEAHGAGNAVIGTKAIHINQSDEDKVSVDVVPAFAYRQYSNSQGAWHPALEGVAFRPSGIDRWVKNYPIQHYRNGNQKNEGTGRRYRRVVRIIKRIRNHIINNLFIEVNAKQIARDARSFLLESLVFNCPPELFQHPEILDDVIAVLQHLDTLLHLPPTQTELLVSIRPAMALKEVNRIKPLFDDQQAWTLAGAANFIRLAREYMEL